MTDDHSPVTAGRSFLGIIVHSFFIIPFLIAVFCVLMFTAVHMLTREDHSVYDYLNDIKTGGLTKRWQAAFELSKILAHPQNAPRDDAFIAELIKIYRGSVHDDPRVRQYLALAMGRTGNPAFFPALTEDIQHEKEDILPAVIYSLGTLRDERAVDAVSPYLNHADGRIRSMAAVALGNIGSGKSAQILKKSLSDTEPNVQWGAALSLAQMADAAGKEIIAQLLDRRYLSHHPQIDAREQDQLILAAITASARLHDPDLNRRIAELSRTDPDMKVRAAAMNYVQQALSPNAGMESTR